MKSVFPFINAEKQAAFESIATIEQKDNIPCICGYYGRACYQMNDVADRAICTNCPLAVFCED